LSGDEVIVTGWLLDPVGPITPQLYLDGDVLMGVSTHEPTPGIAEVFPTFEGAGRCGFSVRIDTTTLAAGTHLLAATRLGEEIPGALQYFAVERCSVGPDRLDDSGVPN
jgi:hypothetical protein